MYILYYLLILTFLVIASFLLIMTGNFHSVDFYFQHIIKALPRGATYAWMAVVGIGLILLGLLGIISEFVKVILNIAGSICLVISLLLFFWYNNPTAIKQPGPLITLILFGLLDILFVIYSIYIWFYVYFATNAAYEEGRRQKAKVMNRE